MTIRKFLYNPVLNNIIWLILEKIVTLSLIFYSEGLIARSLTKELYGQWIYSLNLVTLLSSIALIAGAEVAVPTLSRNKKIRRELIASIFSVRLFFSIIAYIGVNVYTHFFINENSIRSFISVLAFIIILSEPISVIINYYQAIVSIKKIVLFRVLSLASRVLIVVISYNYHLDPEFIALSRVVEMLVLALLLGYLWKVKKFGFRLNKKICKVIISRGVYFWPSLVLMYVYLRADRFFVEHYTSFTILALYGIAVQLTEQTFVLTKMIIQSVSPIYIFSKVSKNVLKKNILRLICLILAVNSAIIIFSYLLLPTVVPFLFGNKYYGAVQFTLSMLPALLFYSIDSVLMQIIFREKMGGALLIKWGGGVVIMSLIYITYFQIYKGNDLALIYNINYFIMLLMTLFLFFIRFKNARYS
ncbi:oligosaccharide flippase family protein [Citrobacter portucalensis]|uniref:oligosaccharide flippase family protein n=1 Tax=Citrobacter portucalensis TaxID=1639133 RepID=UPI003896DB52